MASIIIWRFLGVQGTGWSFYLAVIGRLVSEILLDSGESGVSVARVILDSSRVNAQVAETRV